MTRRRALLAVAGLGLGALAALGLRSPSADRAWVPEHLVAPHATREGTLLRVDSLRNFRYSGPGTFERAWDSRTYDLDRLTSVWFVLTPFSRQWRGPAHSFVTFGFADSQFVAVSVEARREEGERYGALTGLFRSFELIYVIGDERDLIGQRAAFGDYPVYLYPIRASRQRIREMFVAMLERANALRERPEFYNTLVNNCTSNVVRHVNMVAPATVPSGLKTILPGYTDEVAHRLGLLDTRLPIEAARQRFRINDAARKYLHEPDFSLRIRGASSPAGLQ